MLTAGDVKFVADRFNIYDHNWRFYRDLLGDVVLVEDVLAYCDGAGLYLAAFSLERPGAAYQGEEIAALIIAAARRFPGRQIRFVNVWGRFEDPPTDLTLETPLTLHEMSDYFETAFDTVFDLQAFDAARTASATRRLAKLERSSVLTSVTFPSCLGSEHLDIMERWLADHALGAIQREFLFSLQTYVARNDVAVCEARRDGLLVGFSIFDQVAPDRLVALNAFPLRGPGLRVGDALFAATINYARARSLRWIHRGYSASQSLLQTKESWGSCQRSLSYREAFYVTDPVAGAWVTEGRFLWRMRLGALSATAVESQVPPPPRPNREG